MNGAIQDIVSETFYGCKELTTITLHSKIKEIGKESFSFCYTFTCGVKP